MGSKIYLPFRNSEFPTPARKGRRYNAARSRRADDKRPNRSYLSKGEERASVRGTTFQKRKERLATVFAVNCTGSHILPIRYIGKSKMPRSFRNYPNMKEKYSS
eukprot:IDg21589t1